MQTGATIRGSAPPPFLWSLRHMQCLPLQISARSIVFEEYQTWMLALSFNG